MCCDVVVVVYASLDARLSFCALLAAFFFPKTYESIEKVKVGGGKLLLRGKNVRVSHIVFLSSLQVDDDRWRAIERARATQSNDLDFSTKRCAWCSICSAMCGERWRARAPCRPSLIARVSCVVFDSRSASRRSERGRRHDAADGRRRRHQEGVADHRRQRRADDLRRAGRKAESFCASLLTIQRTCRRQWYINDREQSTCRTDLQCTMATPFSISHSMRAAASPMVSERRSRVSVALNLLLAR